MITILRTWSRGDYRRLSFIQVRVSGRSSCSHSFSPLDVGNIGAHHDNAKTKGLAPLKASRTLATKWLLDGETDNKELPKPIRRVGKPLDIRNWSIKNIIRIIVWNDNVILIKYSKQNAVLCSTMHEYLWSGKVRENVTDSTMGGVNYCIYTPRISPSIKNKNKKTNVVFWNLMLCKCCDTFFDDL